MQKGCAWELIERTFDFGKEDEEGVAKGEEETQDKNGMFARIQFT